MSFWSKVDAFLEELVYGDKNSVTMDYIIPTSMPTNIQTSNGSKLYTAAASLLDTQVAPKNAADGYGMFGCALTVNGVAERAWGRQIGGGASTEAMLAFLEDTSKYALIAPQNVLPGDIIISATGTANDPSQHGHVGICAKYGILSNNSEDGRLEEQWTLPAWFEYYGTTLGFPVKIFRAL